jgi:hypothetical protein
MLSFSVLYSNLIKFPYFADITESRGDRGRKQRGEGVKERMTLQIILISKFFICKKIQNQKTHMVNLKIL